MKNTGVIALVSSKDFLNGTDRDSVNLRPNFSSTKTLLMFNFFCRLINYLVEDFLD